MIIIRNLKLPLSADFDDKKALLECALGKKLPENIKVRLYKRAIDARKRDSVHFVCSFLVEAENELETKLLKILRRFDAVKFEEPHYIYEKAKILDSRPIVIGFGPAGMFSALALAKAGIRPIVFEMGKDADSRKADVDAFFKGGKLNTRSNIQFGEGGAGTFSDGKLNTGIKDSRISEVLKVFADSGAGERILYDAKPHIGTDVLVEVVKNIRKKIISLGGEIYFESEVTEFLQKEGKIHALKVRILDEEKVFECERVILAIGHSARDTFSKLKNIGIKMEPKPFAVGVRIEHRREFIDRSQYGEFADCEQIGSADYKLSCHLENGRGVFSFCMCPGGVVVNASSEDGGVVTNGMSNSLRNGENSNSALLVGVGVEDYYKGDVLDGMYFQREIESLAFEVGKGFTVSQTVGDFLKGVPSVKAGNVNPTVNPATTFDSIEKILPQFITDSLKSGIKVFDRKIPGFADENALLTGPETRSSSPVKIIRGDDFLSSLAGLYPCGEGAGYAGGITSAAVDGLRTAEMVIKSINEA